MSKGFTAIKFGWGVFGQNVIRDIELVKAAREAVGDRVELLVDCLLYTSGDFFQIL